MKKNYYYIIMSIVCISIVLLGVTMIHNSDENYYFANAEECIFTAYIEKSWVTFRERPWVIGTVYNCDESIEYQKKDTLYIRILDINGDVIDDGWKPEARANPVETPNKYIFNDQVYRGGSQGNADVTGDKVIYIRENQYFFYMPQIHSLDFEHRGIYQIELTYNNEKRIILFAVLDPEKRWDKP